MPQETMKAVRVHAWRPFDELPLEDIPRPLPAPGQILLDIKATGVSFATSLVVEGRYQRKPPLPFTPGTEVAGVVLRVGEGVSRFAAGDRVCAVLDWGGLAEEACAFAVNTYRLPDSLDFTRAIAFTHSYATSAAALTWTHLLNVQPGQTLLIHGAAGGVGLAAVEIGKVLGARVIATASSAEKLALAKAHGADHVIDYRKNDFRTAVLALTDQRGVDAVYDPVGGDVFMQSLRCMAPEGRIMPVGFAGGEIPQIPANLLLVKNLAVCGLNLGLYFGWGPRDERALHEPRMRALMDRLFQWFEAGAIKPVIGRTYPLSEYRLAMADVLARRSLGRIALVRE